MVKKTEIHKFIDPVEFLARASASTTTKAVEEMLAELPIIGENDYIFDPQNPSKNWKEGSLHWFPVGGDRGNAGRISLAGKPANPLGERTINSMEAIIELQRQLELLREPTSAPISPRDAARRYFDLPPLEDIPRLQRAIRGQKPREYARDLAKRIRVKLIRSTRPTQYSVAIEDEGIGQAPANMHSTLLSLGSSDKADKAYLIGVFGQGGSSTYAASTYSWVLSRRHPLLLGGASDGVGWTVIKRIHTKHRRDVYFAYLAVHPNGEVISFPVAAADKIELKHGTRFMHVNYDFGKTEPARTLYPALNHLLFDPVLPYELYTGPDRRPDPMYGNGYRLSLLASREEKVLDKSFGPQTILRG